MRNKHNNLKRIFHRATEELGSTFTVSRNTSMTNFVKIINAKVLNYRLNKNGSPESVKDTECLMKKHDILMEFFEKNTVTLQKHMCLTRIAYQSLRTIKIKYGFAGGKELIMPQI